MKGVETDFDPNAEETRPGFGPKQALTTAIAAIFYSQWPTTGQASCFDQAETFIKLAEERYGDMRI